MLALGPSSFDIERVLTLLNGSDSAFINSQTSGQDGSESLRGTRRSKSASVPRDAVTQCISDRALRFQGFDTPLSHLEPLQLVRYQLNETYHLHTDWFTSPLQTTSDHGGNRLTSFFAYVLASGDITGGGTTFPLLKAPRDECWCQYIDCDVPTDEGVTFLPIPGNAVFWVNMVNGRGDQRVLHSGDVLTSGTKVGLNIWTREGPLSPSLRGELDDEEDDKD
jgi:prolyl 4-hydroxylase